MRLNNLKESIFDILNSKESFLSNEVKSPEYYHKIAKDYIIKQSKYLDESEPKYYLDKELGYKYIKFASIMKPPAESYGQNFRFMDWQLEL